MSLADRHNTGKPEMAYIFDFPIAMRALEEVARRGAEKYSLNNWKKGFPIRQLTNSLTRHLIAFHNGENYDDEGISHIGAIIWNACAIAETLHRHPELDDRDFDTPYVDDTPCA